MWPILLLLVAAPTQPATIDVFPDSVIAAINPCLLGSGDEMNEDLSQIGVDSLVLDLGLPLLRMGGIAAEYLDWEANDYNGIWYVDFVDTIIWADTLSFGIDNLLQFCERVDTEPVLTVNFQINDPGKAARLVEYCNGDVTSPMGAIRAARGHPEPYNVTLWCIGNEPDISGILLVLGQWQWTMYRHFGIPFDEWSWRDSSFVTADQFSALVDVYIDSMRARSPIPIEIGGLSLASDLSWVEPVIGGNNSKIDWMDIHYYPNASFTSDSTMYEGWLAALENGGSGIAEPFSVWYRTVCETVEQHSGGYEIQVNIFEYGGGMILAEDWIWWNYVEGLFMADAIGHFAVAGVPKAAAYSIYEGRPDSDEFPLFGKIRGDTLSLRMAGHALKLFNAHFRGSLVQTVSDIDGLNAYSCISEDDTLAVFVVNKKLNVDFATTIGIHNFSPNDTMEVWDIRHDTTFAAPWNGTKGIIYQGEYPAGPFGFSYTFPKASVTVLLIPPEEFSTEDVASNVMQSIKLDQNHPNPFSTRTTISFWAPNQDRVELQIYNIAGRCVKTLRPDPAGRAVCSLAWDGTSDSHCPVGSGVYIYRVLCDGVASVYRRLTLLR
jgi:hypothetical protein